jgi:hypothetical protein
MIVGTNHKNTECERCAKKFHVPLRAHRRDRVEPDGLRAADSAVGEELLAWSHCLGAAHSCKVRNIGIGNGQFDTSY